MSWEDERDQELASTAMYCPKCEQKTVYLLQRADDAWIQCTDPECGYTYSVAEDAVP